MRKFKRLVGKATKQPKPRKGKVQFITCAEARRRAERHVLKQTFKGAKVLDGAAAGGHIYGVRQENTWVVFKNGPLALKSASVVVICKRTGRVLYEGSANDEG